LVVSGVQQLTDPTLPDRAPDNDSEISISLQSMRSAFCEMRKERQLTDVLFHPVTDSEDDEPRNTLYAHRAYLASCSRHFKHLFTGECIESHVTSGGSYVKVPVEGHSSRCVEIILSESHPYNLNTDVTDVICVWFLIEEFLYEGVVDAITVELAELLEVMELSNYWEIMGLHKKIQYRIIPLINPETVDESECFPLEIVRHSELTTIQSNSELKLRKPVMLSKNVGNIGKITAPSLKKYRMTTKTKNS